MLIATQGAEFSFNNQMFKQVDGVAMGYTVYLLALMKVDLLRTPQNQASTRYVNENVVIFGSELDRDHFQGKLNLLHPALKFIVEKGQRNSLNFLDVSVEKEGTGFLSSI